MPAKWFICPDGQQTEIADCLKFCRMDWALPAGRCLTIRTLRLIADQREWTGKPSTTQLLKGSREAVMEILFPYAIDPQDAIFRIMGTKGHGVLDQYTGGNELGEERLEDEYSTGQFDLYDNGVLSDTKTSGSYKVMKALGYQQIEVQTGEVYKSGAKKGLPKTRKEWVEGGRHDRLDWGIQLNDYRIKLERCGFPVTKMVIEALCRDGGTYIAQSRGITFNGALIPINRISDHWIKRYMKAKADALQRALETKIIPPKCKPRETWGGRKCQKYCNVREFCLKEEGKSEYVTDCIQ
ncbi:MAG TPA: hypothetical protein VEA37_06020 [Flavobacterium sp.]|nr:hypothetical protein [Flavobacterium sp.]